MFGAALQRRRENCGLSLRQLGKRVNYSFGYLGKLERGQSGPQVDVAELLDAELGPEADEPSLTELAVAETEGRASGLRLAHPAQLPTTIADFVGRDRELRRLDEVASSETPGAPRVCLVHGPPAIGKSALAVHWAHGANDFPDGQLFVDLGGWSRTAPRPVGDVLSGLLRSLGVPGATISAELDQQVALFRSLMADRRMLLVLDNGASAEQVLSLLPGASGCMVVVTSRARLAGVVRATGAVQLPLGPLALNESVGLLAACCGPDRIEADRAAAEMVASRCGHVPLALRAVADQITHSPHQTLAEMAERLSTDAGLGQALADDDGDPADVHEVIGWSDRRLSDQAHQLLLALGLHPGDTSVAAAAAMMRWPEAVTRQALDQLRNEYLVDESDRDRIEVGPVVRAWAARRAHAEMPDQERTEAGQRWVLWYLHSAAAARQHLAPHRPLPALPDCTDIAPSVLQPESRREAMTWFAGEVANLLSAVERARHLGHRSIAWRLAVVWADYLETTQYWGLRMSLYRTTVEVAREAEDAEGTAWCLHHLGETMAQLRHWQAATSTLTEALTLRRVLTDSHGAASTRCVLGELALDMGRYQEARQEFERARDTFASIGDSYGIATALRGRGAADYQCGNTGSGRANLEEALQLFDDLRDRRGVSFTLRRIAETHLDDPIRGLDYLDRESRMLYGLDDHRGIAHAWQVRGELLQASGDAAGASEAWRTALLLFDQVVDPRAADVRSRLVAEENVIPTWNS